MVDFLSDLEAHLSGILQNSRRARTPTERVLAKLTDSVKFSAETLVYPSGQGSNEIQQHFIKFQVWETAGQSESEGKGKSKVVNGISNIDGQPVKQNASKITRKTTGIGNIPMVQREAIVLYMPEDIKTAYSAEWDLGEIGVGTGQALNVVKNVKDSASLLEKTRSIFSASGELIKSALNKEALGDLGISAAQALAQTDSIRNTVSASTRTTRSPHLDFLFKSIGTRQFNFEFRFNPFDEAEAEETFKIIKSFKMNMHPKLKTLDGADKPKVSTLGVFYQYPSVYKISFHTGKAENTWMHKMAVCALVGMDVDYTAAGTSSFLRKKDGKGSPPADVNITLSFIELDILSRENIEEGF